MTIGQSSVADEFAVMNFIASGQSGWNYAFAGAEITVNSTYARRQYDPDAAKLANGNHIVTWIEATTGTSANRLLKGQIYAPDGTPVGGELNFSWNGGHGPVVAGLAGGGFVLAYASGGLVAQLFDDDGVPAGPAFNIIHSTVSAFSQGAPDIAALPGGGFAIVWEDERTAGGDTSRLGVHLRVFDQDGAAVGGDVLVNTATFRSQFDASIAVLGSGGYVVSWTDSGPGGLIKAQIFNADGTRLGTEFVVSGGAYGSVGSSVTALANGNFAVAWYESQAHHVQVFTPAGVPVGPQASVASNLGGVQTGPELAALSDGGYAIVWTTEGADAPGDGSGRAVAVQVYTAGGEADGGPRLVNSQTNGDQLDPAILGLADGRFLVAWSDVNGAGDDDDEVRAQIFALQAPPPETEIVSDGGGDTAAVSVAENGALATIVAAQGNGGAISYQIAGGADAALFTIDAVSGELRFAAAPDFEAPGDADGDNLYEVLVSASDGTTADTQAISVAVTDEEEAIAIVSGGGGDEAAVSIDENVGWVLPVLAVDPDGNEPLYGIAGGADAALFALDPVSHMLRFIDLPDFEAPGDADGDNVYEVILGATDGQTFDYQTVLVMIGNVYEGLQFDAPAYAFSLEENASAAGAVLATGEGGAAIHYAIAGGPDADRFTIDALSGALSLVDAPDFEAPGDADGDNVYEVLVSADDGTSSVSASVSVTIGNADEGVAIVSNGGGDTVWLGIAENSVALGQIEAVDEDGDAVSYAIVGGADAAWFAIDAATGLLRFVAAPDYEAAADADGDNVYKVQVAAISGAFSDVQAFEIAIMNVNEPVVIGSNGGGASAAVSVVENNSVVTTVVAADPEGAPVTYSIISGGDASDFTINAQTGALRFVSAPDFESPDDGNGDNVYAVTVRATSGQHSDVQTIYVTVTNTRDGYYVTGTSASETINGSSPLPRRTSNEEDTVYAREGNDTVQGLGGDDWIYGEIGNDVLTGGAGADRLSGGVGADQFVYNLVSDSTGAAIDLIIDFTRVQGDRISLTAIDANSVAAGNQAFAFIGAAAFTNTPGQLRYESAGGATTIFGDVNGDGVADLQIQFAGQISLVAADFLL